MRAANAGPDPPYALVADDDAAMRALIGAALAGTGLRVVEVPDGEALIAALLRPGPPPALVVTDLQMPRMTGIRALRRIQRLGLSIPTVLVTAFGSSQVHADALRHGAAAVLDKPFRVRALQELVERLALRPEPPLQSSVEATDGDAVASRGRRVV